MRTHIRYVLLLLTLVTSCSGQPSVPRDSVRASNVRTNNHPVMIKSQGKYSYHTGTGPRTDTNVCISFILEDKSGAIWAATLGEGVYRYDGESFTNFTVRDGLATNGVYCMMEDNAGNIWFGTTGGASRYDGTSFTRFPFSVINGTSSAGIGTNLVDQRGEQWNQSTEVWSMLQDKKGKIWFGTTDGVYCYDGTTFTSIQDLDMSSTTKLNLVRSIVEDRNGDLWFASWANGLCRFDGKSITSFTPNREGFNNLFIDHDGTFWLSRRSPEGGLYRYDGETFTKQLAGGGYIGRIAEDTSGNLWLENAPAGGLIHYDPSTATIISRFTTNEGMAHNNVSSVMIDRSGNVWVGTYGMTLSRYDGKTFAHFRSE